MAAMHPHKRARAQDKHDERDIPPTHRQSRSHSSTQSFTHSLTYSLTHSLTRSLTHSLHSLTAVHLLLTTYTTTKAFRRKSQSVASFDSRVRSMPVTTPATMAVQKNGRDCIGEGGDAKTKTQVRCQLVVPRFVFEQSIWRRQCTRQRAALIGLVART
jgi:hypothetical protein